MTANTSAVSFRIWLVRIYIILSTQKAEARGLAAAQGSLDYTLKILFQTTEMEPGTVVRIWNASTGGWADRTASKVGLSYTTSAKLRQKKTRSSSLH